MNLLAPFKGVLSASVHRGTNPPAPRSTDDERDQCMFSRRLTRFIAIGATAVAIGGGAYGIVSATATNGSGITTTATSPVTTSRQALPGRGESNARSGPAAGGASGTV